MQAHSAAGPLLLAGVIVMACGSDDVSGAGTGSSGGAEGSTASGTSGPDASSTAGGSDGGSDGTSAAGSDSSGTSDETTGTSTGGTVDGATRPAVLTHAETTSALTIELEFDVPVSGTDSGLTVYGTRSVEFSNVTGFGTTTLVGTLESAVVYGEVVSVSYDDTVGDLESSSIPAAGFRQDFVVNNEDYVGGASGAGVERYVSASATGSGDGLTPGSAWSVAQLNELGTTQPGDRINIERGVYTTSLFPRQSGTPGNPKIFEGYDTTEGDLDFDVAHGSLDVPLPPEFPLFDMGNRNGTQRGISIQSGYSYLTFKNIAITRADDGIWSNTSNDSHHIVVDNFAVSTIGSVSEGGGKGIAIQHNPTDLTEMVSDLRIINSFVKDATQDNYAIDGDNLLVYNCTSYSSEGLYTGGSELLEISTDYHIIMQMGSNMVIRDSHAEGLGDLSHTGHGYTFKSRWSANDLYVEDSLVVDSTATNINGAVEFRWDKVRNNTAKNVTISGGESRYAGGIHFRDGATNNTVDSCLIRDIVAGSNGALSYYDSLGEQGTGQLLEGNVVMNTVFDNVVLGIRIGNGQTHPMLDNAVVFSTFNDVATLYGKEPETSNSSFSFTNNLLTGVVDQGSATSGITETYCNYFGGFPMPRGVGNLEVDPALDADFVPSSPALNAGSPVDGIILDRNNDRRDDVTPTIGAVELL